MWEDWTPWGDCSVTCCDVAECGVHIRTRGKDPADDYGGDPCEGVDEEEQACDGHPPGDPDDPYGPCPSLYLLHMLICKNARRIISPFLSS